MVVNSVLSRTNATTVLGTLTIQNIGAVTANNVVCNDGQVGRHQRLRLCLRIWSNLAPGATVTTTVNFANSTPGAASNLVVGGTFTGGTFSTTKRVTIP